MILAVLGHGFAYEMECITRLFYPGERIILQRDKNPDGNDFIITLAEQKQEMTRLTVRVKLDGFDEQRSVEVSGIGPSSLRERELSVLLFELLCEKTKKRPVWGILTGIRPVRLCGKWAESGLDEAGIFERLTRDYLVTPDKARLCLDVGRAQKNILALNAAGSFSLYVGIPFCPTRCLYCSFVSQAVSKSARLLPDYVRLLCEELRHIGHVARNMGAKPLTVYIGGGTPTILEPKPLREVLLTIRENFDLSGLVEYTVEAGRPDTITAEKLDILLELGADRISINPQSMNDNVLRAIGRAHTAGQVVESFDLARRAGFSNINMDLIAGLPGETVGSFANSLDRVIALNPESVTVHSFTLKRSSHFRESEDAFENANPDANAMREHAAKRLSDAGYIPYYLYRQKPAIDNLENVGFARPGFECVYNILSMEDAHDILAAGAGAVTKLCRDGNVRRVYNFKYPYEYIDRFGEVINRKTEELY